MVNTIGFRFDLMQFRKDFSVRSETLVAFSADFISVVFGPKFLAFHTSVFGSLKVPHKLLPDQQVSPIMGIVFSAIQRNMIMFARKQGGILYYQFLYDIFFGWYYYCYFMIFLLFGSLCILVNFVRPTSFTNHGNSFQTLLRHISYKI